MRAWLKRPKRIVRILTASLPIATKRGLLRGELSRGRRDIAVPLGRATLTIARESHWFDYLTMYGALIDRHFDGDYRGVAVLDIGAHKGYFAARVLADGATRVASFEPASQNARHLETAAGDVATWEVHREAVGASAGTITLHLATGSWGHSIHAPVGSETQGTEEVALTALSDALAGVAGQEPILVKINVEGAAGEMIVGTSPADWQPVGALWCDIEVNDPVGADAIAAHLDGCGMTRAELDGQRHLFVRARPDR